MISGVHDGQSERRDTRNSSKASIESVSGSVRAEALPDDVGETSEPRPNGHPPILVEPRSLARVKPVPLAQKAEASEPRLAEPTLSRLGRYIVLGELERGGAWTLLKGYDEELDRQVAIKVLRSDLTAHEGRRLKREARALAKLDHPNMVQVFEVGEAGGRVFVVTELAEGRTLWQWQQQQDPHRQWRDYVKVYLQVGRGIAAAHAAGLVHQDFEPGQVIVDDNSRVCVLGFGLTNAVGAGSEVESVPRSIGKHEAKGEAEVVSLVRTNRRTGPSKYVAPERLRGCPADALSNQYSFSMSLYEAVYGALPYGKASDISANSMGSGRALSTPAGVKAPTKLQAVLQRGMAIEPKQRWSSMDAMLDEFEILLAPRARRWVVLSLVVGLFGLVGGVALERVVQESERCSDPHRRLTNIWDDERQREVRSAILGTDLPDAPEIWNRVERQFDNYTDAWVRNYTEVCESNSVGDQREMDRRLQLDCMHKHLGALRLGVDALVRVDSKVVENAEVLVNHLPTIHECRNLDAIWGYLQGTEELEILLEPLHIVVNAGVTNPGFETIDISNALEEMDAVVAGAIALGDGLSIGLAKLMRARLRMVNDQWREAENDLLSAYKLSVEFQNEYVAMTAAKELAFTVGCAQARQSEGRIWGSVAFSYALRNSDELSYSNIADALDEISCYYDE